MYDLREENEMCLIWCLVDVVLFACHCGTLSRAEKGRTLPISPSTVIRRRRRPDPGKKRRAAQLLLILCFCFLGRR
ncbi:hypothetical protein OIU84_023490 [Salix udensis]|uniref:Uncharacterized protein n=1 Tax=Salix udensis TaxID=889485 RepID=A0AAD6PFU7_9ROSI|nr:hypothetical protein OIU84_023490 [Salix udensis]